MSRIFIRNISQKTKLYEIESLFAKIGTIVEIINKPNFAFINFNAEKDAAEAVNQYNDYTLNGSKLVVEIAKTRSEKMAERLAEKCFKCSQYGHWAKDCGINRREKRIRRNRFENKRRSPKRSFSRSFSSRSRSRS